MQILILSGNKVEEKLIVEGDEESTSESGVAENDPEDVAPISPVAAPQSVQNVSNAQESPHSQNVTGSQQNNPQQNHNLSDQPESSTRIRNPPGWMQDYYTGSDMFEEEEAGLAMYSSFDDPASYEEACDDPKWISAMKTEIEAIRKNDTWELVDLPAGSKAIGVKWLFKTKLNEKGEVDKYKARLVVKGYAQKEGVDYGEVFAPVARWDTIQILLAIAAKRKWLVKQLDVKSAFLHGELKEVVYVEQPKGFIDKGSEAKVYRLKKALYGLKQAPRAWFHKIEGYFIREGSSKSKYDHSLFIKKVKGKMVIVSLYVDDLIYTGNDQSLCEAFKHSMQNEFDMTDLGIMKYFLGVEALQESDGIIMFQAQYAKSILKKSRMWEANGVKNPIVPGCKLVKSAAGKDVNGTLYMSLIGSLMYLTVSRPDLMYVVSLLSRFMADPKKEHLEAAKRVLRYIKQTLNYGLKYNTGGNGSLLIYTDSNYARDLEDRKSTSGYVCLLSGAAISWSSKKQSIVTLSTTEAEYVAATSCVCHCVWLKGLLEELGEKFEMAVDIWCDNSSTIKLSKNPVMHSRTKHIDVRFHYLRDLVNQEVVNLEFCKSEEQVADIMTKPLKMEMFESMRWKLGVDEVKQVVRH
ncbi:hypothetical protein E3N88_31060 [Mikania micrantha]|uniref:Reverse transcriptase Ty1/copia-type domain-containing protein n=1 Tax=Mikania micrantha TaxID=192012 RepID=A0A5N6MP82_9ASTR|nr:hypothetical protein E3N88_31060 [Mikania micrantha]